MVDLSINGIIRLQRGDSCKFPIFLNKGSEICPMRYKLGENDQLYFALTEPNQPFECALLKKVLTYRDCNPLGDVVLKLTPEDTEHILPGKYFYEIKARFVDNNIIIDYNIDITDTNSILNIGSRISKGSIIWGQPIETINSELIVQQNDTLYALLGNINLQYGDSIKYGSIIRAGSVLNEVEIESDYYVNTVVKKTEFWIE